MASECYPNVSCVHIILVVFAAVSPFAAVAVGFSTGVWWPVYAAIGLNLAIAIAVRLCQLSRRRHARKGTQFERREQKCDDGATPKISDCWDEAV